MARAIWSGAISFGLVNVPVKLYSAVSPKDVSFHQLDEKTGSRVRYKRVSEETGKEVPYDQIVKGYEVASDRYVTLTPEELEAFAPGSSHSIDIEEFVDLDQIDPIYFDHPYYVVPAERADKAYRLLLDAMRDSGKVGIGRFVLRTKEYLVAIRPLDDVLCLHTMLFPDEVVSPKELKDRPGKKAEVSDRELKMARQLIESLSTDFEPEKHNDTYREKVLELIGKKAKGQEIVVGPKPETATKVTDLMAALEASLAAVKGDRSPAKEAEKTPAKKTAKPAKKAAAKKSGSRRKSA